MMKPREIWSIMKARAAAATSDFPLDVRGELRSLRAPRRLAKKIARRILRGEKK